MRKLGFLALAAVVGLTAVPAWAVPLTILHTNDTHDHLAPFDTRQGKSLGGIARRATLIARLKATLPAVLVLDAGDTFQGTPIYNYFKGEADYATLDQAGYDATTVGNHDLDDGLANLQKQVAGRHFQLIASNILDPKTNKPIFTESRVYERNGLKIGVFGIMGHDALAAVAEKNQVGFKLGDPIATAQQMADGLRAKCDLVVMLSHCGVEEDLVLAGKVRGVDLIVGGHSHTKLDHPREVLNGDWKTLVVQDFQWGEELGRLDLDVQGGKIASYQGNLLPITSELPENATVAATVATYSDPIAKAMAVVIGQSPTGLSTEGKNARDCELGDWTADLLQRKTGSEIGIMNSGGLRAALQPGPVTVEAVFTIFPFDNAVVTLDVTGATLQQLLDKAARTTGKGGALQYSGLTFRLEKGKAVNVMAAGAPLDLDRTYHVATIDYLAQGNDGYTAFTQGKHYQPMGKVLRDLVLESIKAEPTVTAPATGRIDLAN